MENDGEITGVVGYILKYTYSLIIVLAVLMIAIIVARTVVFFVKKGQIFKKFCAMVLVNLDLIALATSIWIYTINDAFRWVNSSGVTDVTLHRAVMVLMVALFFNGIVDLISLFIPEHKKAKALLV